MPSQLDMLKRMGWNFQYLILMHIIYFCTSNVSFIWQKVKMGARAKKHSVEMTSLGKGDEAKFINWDKISVILHRTSQGKADSIWEEFVFRRGSHTKPIIHVNNNVVNIKTMIFKIMKVMILSTGINKVLFKPLQKPSDRCAWTGGVRIELKPTQIGLLAERPKKRRRKAVRLKRKEYYELGAYYGKPTTFIMLSLAQRLQQADSHSIWWELCLLSLTGLMTSMTD